MSTTLLKAVQDVLVSIDGDEVNSIGETVEANSVVSVLESCFIDMVNMGNVRELEKPFTLTAIGSTKPTLMERPDNVVSIDWIKYDIREDADPYPSYRVISYLPIDQFLEVIHSLPGQSDTTRYGSFVQSIDGSNVTFWYRKDNPPNYYTTIDDTLIVFDSYDVDTETNLQESKTICFGRMNPTFTKTDAWTIPLDSVGTKQLIEAAKARASVELRQTENPKAEKAHRRYEVRSQFTSRQIGPKNNYANLTGFGRRV
jgi:hypothetical protein